MASQLGIYNRALRFLGERRLTSTSEARDVRYHLDDAYDDVKAECLEMGYWNFAMRSVQIASSDSLTPEFEYTYAFEKPTDWVRTYIVSSSPFLKEWLFDFTDEATVWYSNVDPMWVKYVSNDSTYGGDLAKWPESYEAFVAASLALDIAPAIPSLSADKIENLERRVQRLRMNAESKDATNEPPAFPPTGTWVNSRGGGRGPKTVAGGMIF